MKEIQLTQGKTALVDDSDYEYLNQWKWHVIKQSHTFYAGRKMKNAEGKWFIARMHRVILGLINSKMQVDHKDHNGLNNQRGNIRITTQGQNMRNRLPNKNSFSQYKGVFFHKTNDVWVAQIRYIGGKKKHLGQFKNEKDAAVAYNDAAIKLYAEYACLNNVV